MDRVTQKFCALLKSADPIRRCAGAIALAELAPKDPAVLAALSEALPNAGPMLTSYLLAAFEAINAAAALPHLLPLLDAEELETKLRAAALLAKSGARAVPAIAERLAAAPPSQKPLFVDVLTRIRTREAFSAILALLPQADVDLAREACEAVRRHIADVPAGERDALHRTVAAFMAGPQAAGRERVLTSCLLMLGALGRPQARELLLKHAAPAFPLYVRRHALIALKGLELAGPAAAAVARELAPLLEESDDGLVRHALDILERLPQAGSSTPAWARMLKSGQPPVRAFAARKLAEAATPAALKALLALLGGEDAEVADLAASCLARQGDAVPMLVEALAREPDPARAWQLAKVLKPHGGAADAAAVRRIAGLAAQDLAGGSPRYEPLLYFLRHAQPEAADGVLREAGLAHLKARRWGQAVECLRRLVNTPACDDEVRYALALANLKESAKDLAPHLRAEDHSLIGLRALLRAGDTKLAARLKKEKCLEAPDLYYAGFHFAEAAGEFQPFGLELLAHVAAQWPRSPEGKAAKAIASKAAKPARKKRS